MVFCRLIRNIRFYGDKNMELEKILPAEIEKRSFEIITEELGQIELDSQNAPIIKRVIHTTADFDYAHNLRFSPNAVFSALNAIKEGAAIITDTKMVLAGINQGALKKLNIKASCFIADTDVKQRAEKNQTTRASASMDKAAGIEENVIFAIGNAPTALIRLYELIQKKNIKPSLIIGVPVGFVNVIQAKELTMTTDVPYIVAKGRKGGSNVAAAICNSLLYLAGGK